jgi:hypothetical protein
MNPDGPSSFSVMDTMSLADTMQSS